jgi:hypothetical protein
MLTLTLAGESLLECECQVWCGLVGIRIISSFFWFWSWRLVRRRGALKFEGGIEGLRVGVKLIYIGPGSRNPGIFPIKGRAGWQMLRWW